MKQAVVELDGNPVIAQIAIRFAIKTFTVQSSTPNVFRGSRLLSAEAVAVDLVNSHLVADNSLGGMQ